MNDPAIKRQLEGILTIQEWNCLYPLDPGKHISSADFDLSLILKLLRTICGLTPPVTGWYAMPCGVSFEEDLARIECYCRSFWFGEMTDAEFINLWREISEVFLTIAARISSEKRTEWEIFINELLQDPLRVPEVDNYVHELQKMRDVNERVRGQVIRQKGDQIQGK